MELGDFVTSVEHTQRFLTVAVCQSCSVGGWQSLFESRGTWTGRTRLDPSARDVTLMCKDTKRGFGACVEKSRQLSVTRVLRLVSL